MVFCNNRKVVDVEIGEMCRSSTVNPASNPRIHKWREGNKDYNMTYAAASFCYALLRQALNDDTTAVRKERLCFLIPFEVQTVLIILTP